MPSITGNLSSRQQHGMTLLEVLISILIFSLGILALMGMQAAVIQHSSAAKYRTDASLLANQLFGQLWSNRQSLEASPDEFKHNPDGATRCAPTPAPSTNALVTAWLSDVANTLPGAVATKQQVKVGAQQLVTVTICWQIPGEAAMRNHVEVAQLVGSPIN